MFQYAVGRALALRAGAKLKLDTGYFGKYFVNATIRNYNLHVFNIVESFATENEIAEFKGNNDFFSKVKRKLGWKVIPPRAESLIREKQFHFDAEILSLRDNVYLHGYWQSEKYFIDAEDIIRQDFTFKIPPSEANQHIIDNIKKVNSVSIHIRRGDYITHKRHSKVFSHCSLDYYSRGAKLVADRQPNPHYFVFSDDIGWAKENLKLKYPTTFVDINDEAHSYEDMRLMSLCNHNIIANSSFSWWGAWLNVNPKKVVIAPQNWCSDYKFNTQDRIPENWIKI